MVEHQNAFTNVASTSIVTLPQRNFGLNNILFKYMTWYILSECNLHEKDLVESSGLV